MKKRAGGGNEVHQGRQQYQSSQHQQDNHQAQHAGELSIQQPQPAALRSKNYAAELDEQIRMKKERLVNPASSYCLHTFLATE